jgi:LysM repeat protein
MNDSTPTGMPTDAPTTSGSAFTRPALVPDDGRAMSRVARSMLNTVPIVLAGSMALGLTGPVASVDHAPRPVKQPQATPRPILPATPAVAEAPQEAVVQTAATAPSSYTVKSGDTVASIAGSFGLSTASVLALNGLSWKSTIFPGQTLSLVAGAVAAPSVPVSSTRASSSPTRYTIARGDTLSSIAGAHGVSTSALLQANGLSWSSIIYPGQQLALPGAAAPARTPAPPAATPPAASTGSSSYIIRSGDTVASIAARTGVSTKALLSANGLSFTSTIYAGTTLTIPATSTSTSAPATAVVSTSATPLAVGTTLTAEQQGNARTIIRVGRELGVGDRAIVVALAAAAQESSLRNIDWGDRDSVGLYQQRPSTGWGTVAQLTDPVHATKLFFGGRANPNVGKTRGLLDVPGWSGMSLTAAAQAVQLSAYPTAYAKWEGPATSWLATLG